MLVLVTIDCLETTVEFSSHAQCPLLAKIEHELKSPNFSLSKEINKTNLVALLRGRGSNTILSRVKSDTIFRFWKTLYCSIKVKWLKCMEKRLSKGWSFVVAGQNILKNIILLKIFRNCYIVVLIPPPPPMELQGSFWSCWKEERWEILNHITFWPLKGAGGVNRSFDGSFLCPLFDILACYKFFPLKSQTWLNYLSKARCCKS